MNYGTLFGLSVVFYIFCYLLYAYFAPIYYTQKALSEGIVSHDSISAEGMTNASMYMSLGDD